MSESNAISGHGVSVLKGGVAIPELRNVTLPTLSRDVFEVTRQADLDDVYKVGLRKHSDLILEINLLFNNASHDDLLDAWASGTIDTFDVNFPDGEQWSFDGYVTNVSPEAPVDGAQTARVTIHPSGTISFDPLLETEDGEILTTEDGDPLEA